MKVDSYSLREIFVDADVDEVSIKFMEPHFRSDGSEVQETVNRRFKIEDDPELASLLGKLYKHLKKKTTRKLPIVFGDENVVLCDTCVESACCRKYDVFVTKEDIRRINQYDPKLLSHEHLLLQKHWTGDYEGKLRKDGDDIGEKCVFLKPDEKTGIMRCSIYEARPEVCRKWEAFGCTDYDGGKLLPAELERVKEELG